MPSREPELYKDKIEVSLDGRQIFYLFFGGAVVVGLVFVLGVMIGRRVEARGHIDRAQTQTARDPLAALDRLERADHLSFRGALTGAAEPTEVEKAIGELEKRRAAPADKKAAEPRTEPTRPEADRARADKQRDDAATDVRTEARADRSDTRRSDAHADKPVTRPDAKSENGLKVEPRPEPRTDAKLDGKADAKLTAKADARSEAKTDGKPDAKLAAKPDAKLDGKTDARPDGKADAKLDGRHDAKLDGKADAKLEGKAEARPDAKLAAKPDGKTDAKSDGKTDAKSDVKTDGKTDAKSDGKTDAKAAEARTRFTLQLSSFQDRSEAEAFLSSVKSAGFQPYLTEAEVGGKGTFYRVRLGSYRSLDAANTAKDEYEKAARKTAQVMRL